MRGGGWLATRNIAAGALIIEEGDPAEEAYIVVSGECEAFKMVDGQRMSLRVMGPGEVFGETALLTGKPRTASVVARVDCRLKVVTRKSIEQELAQNDWMASFVNVLADRFCELDEVTTRLRAKYEKGVGWATAPGPASAGGVVAVAVSSPAADTTPGPASTIPGPDTVPGPDTSR